MVAFSEPKKEPTYIHNYIRKGNCALLQFKHAGWNTVQISCKWAIVKFTPKMPPWNVRNVMEDIIFGKLWFFPLQSSEIWFVLWQVSKRFLFPTAFLKRKILIFSCEIYESVIFYVTSISRGHDLIKNPDKEELVTTY